MMDLDTLKFDDRGLIPAIVQDADTGKVLTLAYMNRESLNISLEKKLTCFWSRSRHRHRRQHWKIHQLVSGVRNCLSLGIKHYRELRGSVDETFKPLCIHSTLIRHSNPGFGNIIFSECPY